MIIRRMLVFLSYLLLTAAIVLGFASGPTINGRHVYANDAMTDFLIAAISGTVCAIAYWKKEKGLALGSGLVAGFFFFWAFFM